MNKLTLVLLAVSILGCAGTKPAATSGTSPQWEWFSTTTCPGLRPEDPQLCRGEQRAQIPNQRFEAQVRRARGEQW